MKVYLLSLLAASMFAAPAFAAEDCDNKVLRTAIFRAVGEFSQPLPSSGKIGYVVSQGRQDERYDVVLQFPNGVEKFMEIELSDVDNCRIRPVALQNPPMRAPFCTNPVLRTGIMRALAQADHLGRDGDIHYDVSQSNRNENDYAASFEIQGSSRNARLHSPMRMADADTCTVAPPGRAPGSSDVPEVIPVALPVQEAAPAAIPLPPFDAPPGDGSDDLIIEI